MIGHPRQRHPHRQLGLNPRHGGIQRPTQRDDVAAGAHGHPQPQRLLAHKAHPLTGWINVAPLHFGHIAKPEAAVPDANHGRANRLDITELAARSQINALVGGFKKAGGGLHVLLRQRGDNLADRHAQGGQLGIGQIKVDALGLFADEVDLGHVGHPQQLAADRFSVAFEIGVG